MAAKSIIQIEVDDSQFKKFQDIFQKHQDAVKKLPGQWGMVGGSVQAAMSPFAKFSKQVDATSASFKAAKTNTDKLVVGLKAADRTVSSLVRGTASLAKNIFSATESLLKWASITGVISGLVGAGGLFGIERLAGAAAAARRESQGFGVSSGQLKALQLNYGKAVDVEGLLGKINEARNDVTKRAGLYANGITEADIAKKNNAELLRQLIPNLRKRYEQNPGQAANVPFLTDYASIEELTRLGKMRKEEIEDMRRRSIQDEKTLAIGDNTQRQWQNLSIQLSRAGFEIENVLVKKLAPLAGPISHLSDAVAKAIDTLLETKTVHKWVDELATGIEKLAKYLKSGDFAKDSSAFLEALDRAGGALWGFAESVGKMFGGKEKTLKASSLAKIESIRQNDPKLAGAIQSFLESPSRQATNGQLLQRWVELHPNLVLRTAQQKIQAQRDILARYGLTNELAGGPGALSPGAAPVAATQPPPAPARASVPPAPANKRAIQAYFSELERKRGLPRGFLDHLWYAESSRGANMLSPAGAKGHFGFMDATAAQYGLRDPNDLRASAAAAARYMSDLMKRFHGDLAQAVGAYNWREDRVRAAVAKYGPQGWLSHAPAETQREVRVVLSHTPGSDVIAATNAAGVAQ
jgi:hypothetical protein